MHYKVVLKIFKHIIQELSFVSESEDFLQFSCKGI